MPGVVWLWVTSLVVSYRLFHHHRIVIIQSGEKRGGGQVQHSPNWCEIAEPERLPAIAVDTAAIPDV
jgi:hypothetical protein